MLPSRSEISAEAINMKILTKNHPDSPHSHPHSPHSLLDCPRHHSDSPRSHRDSPRSHHSVPRFPIPAFTDSQLLAVFFLVILCIFNERITILPKANILRIYRMLYRNTFYIRFVSAIWIFL